MHLLRCGDKRTRPHPLLTRRALPEGAVTILVTERMALTRTNWPDVDDVVALNADAEVMRYLDHGRPMTAARVLAEEMPGLMAHNGRADRLGSWVAVTAGPATSWVGS